MTLKHFLVDVESTGPGPVNSVMTEFGVVEFETRNWFHGHLWDFTPTPGNEALPIATRLNPGYTATGGSGDRYNGKRINHEGEAEVFIALISWLRIFGGDRAVFVSDNPGWDYMWMACGFDRVGWENPFGHSSRRIGDFAAGLGGDWKKQSSWKRLRQTRHTHNPVDDAMGNAEALEELMKRAKQKEAVRV